MKTARKFLITAIAASFALVFVISTPYVIAESGYGMHSYHDGVKSFKGHWAIQVEGFQGSIPITADSDRTTLKEQAISLSEATADYPNVMKAKLGKAINENGDKFLVWKLVDFSKDSESGTAKMTIYIVDAGNADNTIQVEKAYDHSMKYTRHGEYGSYGKMKGHFTDLTEEERAEKMAQFKEMKEAFASLSEDDQSAVHSYFKDMKGQFADLTEEEKAAKHAEFKQQVEAFMGLSLDEKINYLKNLAMSFRNQA
ncbi:MAG: hypothetical protein QQN54_01630 [Nitrosopumilus sp.]|jgi:hypothetical protein|nr:hypothetical protein [Nitrososphaerota archaeon]